MDTISILFTEGTLYLVFFVYLFFIALFDSSKQYHKLKIPMAFITMILMSLFIGLRWETGTDWFSYKQLFDDLELDWTFLMNVYHFDIGYVIFNAVVRVISDNYTVFLLVNSFITIYFLYKLLVKWSDYPNLSLFIFYSAFMLSQFMGSNRRMMAIVFLLWAFYYLWENKKKSFLLMVFIAFLFHRSSIVGLVLLYMPREMFSIKKSILALFLAFIIGISELPFMLINDVGMILSSFISHPIIDSILYYGETGGDHLVSSTGSLVLQTVLAVTKRSLFLLFYIYIIRKNVIDKLTGFIFNIYLIGFIGYLCTVGTFFQMVTAYFAIIEIILVSRMYGYASVRTKSVFLIFCLLYGFIQLLSVLNIYPELYMPYYFTFEGITR